MGDARVRDRPVLVVQRVDIVRDRLENVRAESAGSGEAFSSSARSEGDITIRSLPCRVAADLVKSYGIGPALTRRPIDQSCRHSSDVIHRALECHIV